MTEAEVAAMKKEIMDGVTATVTGLIKPLAENQKVLADTMAADVEARKTAAAAAATTTAATTTKKDGTADAVKPLTAEDVARIVSEQVKGATASLQTQQQRESRLATTLKDLPPAYRNQLGSDPAKWESEEQAIRSAYQADLKAAGVKAPEVAGGANGAGGGAAPGGAAIDMSKMTAIQKIQLGLKNDPVPMSGQQQHQQAGAAATTTTTAAAAK